MPPQEVGFTVDQVALVGLRSGADPRPAKPASCRRDNPTNVVPLLGVPLLRIQGEELVGADPNLDAEVFHRRIGPWWALSGRELPMHQSGPQSKIARLTS